MVSCECQNTQQISQNFSTSHNIPRLLSEHEAASVLNVSAKSLRNWRCSGSGPDFYRLGGSKHGVARYSPEQLQAWLSQRQLSNSGQTAASTQEG
jgi:hypothetical protein